MFQLDGGFDKDGELSFLALAPDDVDDPGAAMISGDLISGWSQRDDVVYLRETTYKHYKHYTDGAKIDLIQTLAHHNKATFDAGVDLDGDVFWEVSFKMDDFCMKYGKILDPDEQPYCGVCGSHGLQHSHGI